MKKSKPLCRLCPLLLCFCVPTNAFSQVTIGSALKPREGILLDLKENANASGANTTKALGLPRVALSGLTTLTIAPDSEKAQYTGASVYNSNPNMIGGAGEGFYVWDGLQWNPTVINVTSPFYGVLSGKPSISNTEDSYLNARAVIGGNTIANHATLTVHGSTDISSTLAVGDTARFEKHVIIMDSVAIGMPLPSSRLDVNGDIRSFSHLWLGHDTQTTTGYGSTLNLRGISDNTDPIWMAKYNRSRDYTELRINIGDNPDPGSVNDFLCVGSTIGSNWTPAMTVSSDGRLGIHTEQLTETLNVGGNSWVSGNSYVSGNMGIGTLTPARKLDVVGNANISTTLNVGGVSTLMGNVGIGKTNPAKRLDVSGDATISNSFNVGGVSTLMGNVGIGKSNPTFKLDVVGNTNISTTLNVGGVSTLMGNVGVGIASPVKKLDVRGDVYLSGNVGIGTTAPASKLDVNGTIESELDISVGRDNTIATGYGKRLLLKGVSNNTDEMWLAKYNISSDKTELRIVLGDDRGDNLVVGSHDYVQQRIWVPAVVLSAAGKVGINTEKLTDALTVKGNVRAVSYITDVNAGADFVFEEDYDLPDLESVEEFINTNKHLPDIPAEKEMISEGLNMSEFQIKLLQKIEELTLYVIAQDKKIKKLEAALEDK